MKNIFLFGICSTLSFQYVSVLSCLPIGYWLHYTYKPFVFRALIPALGGDFSGALAITSVFPMLLSIAMIYAYNKYWEQSLWNDVALVVSFAIITIILTRYSNYYDFASTFFFLVVLLLWIEKKYRILPFIFILASLNRETIILIIPILFIIRRRWDILLYVVLYFCVKAMLSFAFSDAPGQTIYIQPVLNFLLHVKYYWATIILIVTGWGTVMLFIYNVQFMRKEFAIFVLLLLPMLSVVYFVAGYAFEIRVFGEVLPLLLMGAFMKGDKREEEKEIQTQEIPSV